MIRVVVAEDSRAARELLVAVLESDPEIRVVGQAENGAVAVELAERLRPDLVTMDIHMPVMDGFAATQEIMARVPTPILIVSSVARRDDLNLSLQATRIGALMVVRKPEHPSSPGFAAERDELVAMARAMAGVKVVRRRLLPAPPPRSAPPAAGARRVELVAIAASTGGPAAIHQILQALPADLAVPVVVVQHIARGFSRPLADWLDAEVPLRVRLAEAGEAPEAGTVYLAPDDRHLEVEPGRLRLSADPPVGGFRPSATHLFRSAALAYGRAAACVILTGMGNDGVEGLRAARRAGSYLIAQSEESSVVYGMPREAVLAGLADASLPPAGIAARLLELARPRPPRRL